MSHRCLMSRRRLLSALIAAAFITTPSQFALAAPSPAAPRAQPSLHVERLRPTDFVDLHAIAPTVVIEIRYASSHNFIGRPIPGYDAPRCLLTRPAADALAQVQRRLAPFELSLKVYDCYRPQRAVDYFVQWAADPADAAMVHEFYPRVDKSALLRDGYVASPSSHSRGSTVDLTIVPLTPAAPPAAARAYPLAPCYAPVSQRATDNSLDMGTAFDCFDAMAHLDAAGLDPAQRAHRMLLATVMGDAGFVGYRYEWWHFTLRPEPYPAAWFDFPVN
jgi:zinc D-Ala-D-Ala dipeptidase